jgi:MFS family permease
MMRALLADRSFRRLTIGQTLSALGDYAMFLALAIWVRDLTGSNAAAGLTFLPFSVPSLFGPALGVYVDRFPRRTIMIWTDVAGALIVLSLLAVRGSDDLWILYAVSFLSGTCLVIYQAARSGLLVGMLPEEQLGEANGLLQSTEQASRLVAPLAGAAMYAVWGGHAVAVLDAATFVASAAFLLSVRSRDLERVTGGRFWPELREGLRHLLQTAELRRLTIGTALVTLVVGMTEVAIFALIDEGLRRPPSFLGVISSVQGVGSIAAGLTVGIALRRVGELRTVAVAAFAAAVAMLAFASSRIVPVFVAALALGVAITLFNVGYVTLLQRRSTLAMQGRIMSAAEAVVTLPYLVSFVLGAVLVSFVPYRTIYLVEAIGLSLAGMYFWRPSAVTAIQPEGAQAAVSSDGS